LSDFTKEEKNILQNLKSGRWAEAEQIAFAIDDSSILVAIRDNVLKATRFWQKRSELFVYSDEKIGTKLFVEWEDFIDFCCEYKLESYAVFLAVKSYIFKKIIDFLSRSSRDCGNSNRETLVLLAYAFYEAEMVDRAVETLEYVLGRFPDEDDYRVYTLLGDIYANLCLEGSHKKDLAIIMFNELFLKCVDTLDLDGIEYEDIAKLTQAIRNDLFPEKELRYWVPIYGYLYGGLTVRRNLRYEEYKKLQERIAILESEIRTGDNLEIIIPKLLNVYFWIFDYYIYQMRTPGGANQIHQRVLELLALLCQVPGYEESAKKLGLCAEKTLDMLLDTMDALNK